MKSKFSLEIVPKQIGKIKDLPKSMVDDIYITYIPGASADEIIDAADFIVKTGFNPVPHCPARTILNNQVLKTYIDKLVGVGVKTILIIGGSVSKPVGIFSSSIELLETGLFENSGISSINIAGHPEGNPDDVNHFENMIKKIQWLKRKNFDTNIVTQWCLSPDVTNSWIIETKNSVKNIAANININLGIAGPAKLTTILKYARICGVSATTSVFMKQGLDIRKIVNHNPDNVLGNLTGYDKLHLYPFGGITELLKWYNNTKLELK